LPSPIFPHFNACEVLYRYQALLIVDIFLMEVNYQLFAKCTGFEFVPAMVNTRRKDRRYLTTVFLCDEKKL
jgi:hypothetical protein